MVDGGAWNERYGYGKGLGRGRGSDGGGCRRWRREKLLQP